MRKKKTNYYVGTDEKIYKTLKLTGASLDDSDKELLGVKKTSLIEFGRYQLARTVNFIMLKFYNLGRSK